MVSGVANCSLLAQYIHEAKTRPKMVRLNPFFLLKGSSGSFLGLNPMIQRRLGGPELSLIYQGCRLVVVLQG